MAKTIDATFDPSSKWKPIQEGVYPAHIKSLETKEVNTRAGDAIVVNMRYRVADEVVKYTQPVWKMDGYKYLTDDDNNKIPVNNGSGKQQEDVVGRPVMVNVKRQEFVTYETKHLPPDQQERRSTFKVFSVSLWEDGQTLESDELEEDVPF